MGIVIRHTIYTMSVRRMSLMLETGNKRMAGIMPKSYVKLMEQFDMLFAGNQQIAMHQEFVKIQMYNKIKNIYPILYMTLLLRPDDFSREIYREHFGKDPETGKDLVLILDEIKRMTKRYLNMFKDEKPPVAGLSFEDIVVGVETVIERPIDRELKLYQFKKYYDLALKRIETIEK